MKINPQASLLIPAFFLVAVSTGAQTVEFISVAKMVNFQQIDATTVVTDPEPISEWNGGPYGFEINVDGTDMDLLAAPVVSSTQFGALDPTYFNGGVMVYEIWDEGWGFGFPNANGYEATSQAAIDALFGNGVYNISVDGTDLAINLAPESFPNPPQYTLTGGAWVDGEYHVPFDSTLTITSNVFSDFGTNTEDAIWGGIWGEDGNFQTEEYLAFASDDPTADTFNLTIPAGTFTAGQYYELEAGFFAATEFQSNPAFPDAFIVGGFEHATVVTIRATPIPEPQPVESQIEAAIMIQFDTVEGSTYMIEESTDLENWWEVRSDLQGFGGEERVFFERYSPQQYYRVTKLN